jgi:CRP-like cAMP-binding protein
MFTSEEEKILQSAGTVFTVQPGHLIYMKGDPAEKVYYILKGRVRVFSNLYSGRELTLDVVEAGRLFGESAFMEGNIRPVCVQAVNKVQMVSFRMTDVLPWFQKKTGFALHFLQLCSNTMDHLTARMEDQCLLDRYGKMAGYILDETASDSVGKGTAGGVLPYTHEELSVSLGLNRSTVTTVLKKFEQEGWLKRGYGFIKVLDRQALQEIVEQQKNR